jgi:branched-chain amino acid transport system ATP-binding protein
VIFGLTVQENLRLGGAALEVAFELFPELEALGRRKVGLLSGGEQQILTMARALSRNPKLILIDELSLGLAPIVVDRLLAAICDAASRGISVVLVEQHVRSALQVANSAIVLARGEVVLRGEASSLLDRLDEIEGTYFGAADVETGSGAPS